VKTNPYDPSNRRISILVKNQDGMPGVLKVAAEVKGPPEVSTEKGKAKQ
jgi:hypothetical protein